MKTDFFRIGLKAIYSKKFNTLQDIKKFIQDNKDIYNFDFCQIHEFRDNIIKSIYLIK